jgi:hypothetical protein
MVCIAVLLFAILPTYSQGIIQGNVYDKDTKEPIIGASIRVANNNRTGSITDVEGHFKLTADSKKDLFIVISYIGYHPLKVKISTGRNNYYLQSAITTLGEVVVTATESRGITSSSKIERHAMEHLQPSSFSDLLELLPGGKASDPVLDSPNLIRLREVPISSSDYATSSLGTSFVIDGAPVSTGANMQSLSGAWDTAATSRDFTNQGVDMRTISTDDIKSVEIVRGIPSVEYGDLTSGLVKIERKKGGHDFSARFKADMDSKLFYIGKDMEWAKHQLSLNLSADYLDAKADPRNNLENYKRLGLSARLNKKWQSNTFALELSSNMDFNGSFDNEKTDPDLNYGAVDKYSSSYNKLVLGLSLNLKTIKSYWLRSISLTSSVAIEHDKMDRTRLVQLSRDTPAATTTEQGESDAVILPYTYTASQSVDGKPLNIYNKISASFSVPTQRISNSLMIGADWQIDKNNGDGQQFDVTRPLYPGVSTRPRQFSIVPATHNVAMFAEESVHFNAGNSRIDILAGVRASGMTHFSNSYEMKGKIYFDPRVNIGWTFPKFKIGNQISFFELAGGIGWHTKMPTMSQLYPDPYYLDLVQLSYYNTNSDYKRINLMTYVIDPTNYSLRPARNLKWEVRADLNISGNRLSVTYFQENMTSGFRSSTVYQSFAYKKYDTSNIDASTLTGPPSLDDLTYTNKQELYGHTITTNGSRTFKKGIEYTFSSKRIESIHTRLTISGAWFKTKYKNSQPVTERPSVVLDGAQLQYAGIYKDDDGYIREMTNTNFTFDTDIPKLKLGFSISAQCTWLTASQTMKKEETPFQYMDSQGNVYDFTEDDKNDTYLKWLVRSYSSSLFERQTVPFCANLNMKATKKLLNDRLIVALFVNKILDYNPSYTRNGLTVRRHVTPYFGVEMNIKL